MTDYSNRYKKDYPVVRLPEVYTPQDRGVESCCCKFVVWGSPETDRYKQMKTSAWIRDVDSWRFYLVKGSTGEEIEIEAQTPVLETSARYATVDWSTILSDYGSGCYTYYIDYDISGITGTQTWGEFQLFPFDLHRFREYVLLQTTLNSLQTEEDIQFRGSNVLDDIAFKGKFSNANPNTVIEKDIYSDRVDRVRYTENLYEYELESKPLLECQTLKILDLHLLLQREISVSDFNPDNHRQYLNRECVVNSVDAPEENSIYATIKAKFGDKKKNQRSRHGR